MNTTGYCSVCSKPLSDYDLRVEADMHTDCWKAVVDQKRDEGSEDEDFISDPIYLEDGRRAKELLKELSNE